MQPLPGDEVDARTGSRRVSADDQGDRHRERSFVTSAIRSGDPRAVPGWSQGLQVSSEGSGPSPQADAATLAAAALRCSDEGGRVVKKAGVSIDEQFRRAHPRSEALFRRACAAIAGGLSHDIRHLSPFPIYVDRAQGSRKWDVDGHELIDYWVGHGALFLGHGHPAVRDAIVGQLSRGTHYGACHELEVRWAEQVLKLMPWVDRIRFVGSGTEATLLAMRLARAATGKSKIVKFEGHFHGWHDYAVVGVRPPFDRPVSAGVPQGVLEEVLTCPPNDWGAFRALTFGRNDIAGVI